MEFKAKEKYSVSDLISIMALLRGEGGCPWDREQDHLTIRKNLIEEAYEVVEAIDAGDPEMLCEELGDLLLQVVFHSRISEEEGDFSIEEVADGICRKLIHRHPHIFSDVVVKDSGEVLENWDAIKKQEKGQKTASDTLHSVPKVLPALMRSQKVQKPDLIIPTLFPRWLILKARSLNCGKRLHRAGRKPKPMSWAI